MAAVETYEPRFRHLDVVRSSDRNGDVDGAHTTGKVDRKDVEASSWLEPTHERPAPSSRDLFVKHFRRELEAIDPDGKLVDRVDDPQSAVRRAVMQVLAEAQWSADIGPFYDGDAVRHLLGREGGALSRQAVNKRRGLLALRTGSGRVVYPAFQFDGRSPVAGLREVLAVFEDVPVSRWTLASWLSNPARGLGGRSPIADLRSGNVDTVVAAAGRWAAALRT